MPFHPTHSTTVPYCAQVDSTGAAAALPAIPAGIAEIALQASNANTAIIYVGNSTDQRWELNPGEPISMPVTLAEAIYHKSASGTQKLNILARGVQ